MVIRVFQNKSTFYIRRWYMYMYTNIFARWHKWVTIASD